MRKRANPLPDTDNTGVGSIFGERFRAFRCVTGGDFPCGYIFFRRCSYEKRTKRGNPVPRRGRYDDSTRYRPQLCQNRGIPVGRSHYPAVHAPIVLYSIRRGVVKGLAVSFTYAVLQMMLGIAEVAGWGLTPALLIGCLLLDYLVPFTLIGLAGLFRERGLPAGSAVRLSPCPCGFCRTSSAACSFSRPPDGS